MTTEIAISEAGITFPSDTGEYRIPEHFWVTVPSYVDITQLEQRIGQAGIDRGLEIFFDFDIYTREHVIRWRPEVPTS